MKIWTRLLVISLAILFGLTACGGDDVGGENNDFNITDNDGENDGEGNDGEGNDGEGNDGEGNDGEGNDGEGNDGEGNDGEGNGGTAANDLNDEEPPESPVCQADFGEADACGGNVVGSWNQGEVCDDIDLEEQFAEVGCDSAEVHEFEYEVAPGSGTLEVTADQFVRDLELIVDADFHIPAECLDFGGGFSLSCDDFAASADDLVGIEFDCTEVISPGPGGGGCDCIADEEILDLSSSGGYETDSDAGVVTFEDGSEQFYCSEGGMLTVGGGEEGFDLPFVEAYVLDVD